MPPSSLGCCHERRSRHRLDLIWRTPARRRAQASRFEQALHFDSGLRGEAMMKQSTDELTSAELGTLERLLQQIERSTSHYEALSVERSASDAQIVAAYQQATGVLLPVRAALEVRGDGVAQAIERVELATSRLAQAYSVLSNPG